MKYLDELINVEDILKLHTDKLNDLKYKYVDELSVSELAFIKGVASTSITSMKKRGYSNTDILKIWGKNEHSRELTNEIKVKQLLSSMDSELLERLGLKRI